MSTDQTSHGYSLPRTGDVPLTFQGELLAETSSHRESGPGESRWHELKLFRAAGGPYVLCIRYRSNREDDHAWAAPFETPETVRDALKAYRVVRHNVGYPPGGGFADRQARLVQDITDRFDVAVTRLVEDLDGFQETLS